MSGPDFGDVVEVWNRRSQYSWGCGVTPQVVLERNGCRWFASHEPCADVRKRRRGRQWTPHVAKPSCGCIARTFVGILAS
jgi:hypothetical protein